MQARCPTVEVVSSKQIITDKNMGQKVVRTNVHLHCEYIMYVLEYRVLRGCGCIKD